MDIEVVLKYSRDDPHESAVAAWLLSLPPEALKEFLDWLWQLKKPDTVVENSLAGIAEAIGSALDGKWLPKIAALEEELQSEREVRRQAELASLTLKYECHQQSQAVQQEADLAYTQAISSLKQELALSKSGVDCEVQKQVATGIERLKLDLSESEKRLYEVKAGLACEVQKGVADQIRETKRVLDEAATTATAVLESERDKVGSLRAELAAREIEITKLNCDIKSVEASVRASIAREDETAILTDVRAALEGTNACLGRLTSGKAAVKGRATEETYLTLLQELLPKSEVRSTAGLPRHMDLEVVTENEPSVLIDTKNYDSTVPKKEIEKFKKDIEHNQKHGILVSTKTGIVGMDSFKIELVGGKWLAVYLPVNKYEVGDVKHALQTIYSVAPMLKDDGQTKLSPEVMQSVFKSIEEFEEKKKDAEVSAEQTLRLIRGMGLGSIQALLRGGARTAVRPAPLPQSAASPADTGPVTVPVGGARTVSTAVRPTPLPQSPADTGPVTEPVGGAFAGPGGGLPGNAAQRGVFSQVVEQLRNNWNKATHVSAKKKDVLELYDRQLKEGSWLSLSNQFRNAMSWSNYGKMWIVRTKRPPGVFSTISEYIQADNWVCASCV